MKEKQDKRQNDYMIIRLHVLIVDSIQLGVMRINKQFSVENKVKLTEKETKMNTSREERIHKTEIENMKQWDAMIYCK